MQINQKIQQQVNDAKIVLYMKGTPDFPQCGFSGKVVHLLEQSGAKFASYNVLEDPELRQGIKDFSQWPTVPQLYVNGEFVGGCDIISAMAEKGELNALLKN